jgi:fatty-acyl-CoA synthase
LNIGMLLEMVAAGAADRRVLGSRAEGLSGAGLLNAARRAARTFLSSGARCVVLLDVNSEALPVVLFGAALAGLPFVPVNYRLTDDQFGAILSQLTPGIVVTGDGMLSRIGGMPGLTVVPRGEFARATLAGCPPDDGAGLPWVDQEEIAVLLFTSGTTGAPKAAVLRHRHLAAYIIGSVEFLGAHEDDAQLISVPPYHIAALSSVLSSVYGGRRVVYLPAFDPAQWVRTVEGEQITHAMLVPTMLDRLVNRADGDLKDLRSLRHLSYGGGRMPVETIEHAMKLMPRVSFVNAYGLTETSSTISVLTPEDHRAAIASSDPAIRARLGSVGRCLPTVEVSVRDAEGTPVELGLRGELWVRGDQVSGEYLDHQARTEDGWFPTRDAGWLDADGFLYLDGRIDDVIVRGGENLSPGEIEDALMSHPGVADAAVVGIPDSEWGEAVAAAVVLRPGARPSESELQDWVRERLRSTKTPKLIRFRDEMPYNETGKLLRRVIRSELS